MRFDMKKPCSTCPFRDDIPLDGAPDWLNDVVTGFINKDLSHSCHQSDPKACGFKGSTEKQHCMGVLGLMKNEGENISHPAILATLKDELDWEKVSTVGIYKDLKTMIFKYLQFWKVDHEPNRT